MATEKGNLFLRNDTIFGICEGLGEDLGINPNFIRVPLAAGIIFAPMYVIGIYLAMGVVVLASRLLFPDRRAAQVEAEAPALHAVATDAPAVRAEQREERILEAA